MQGQDTAPRYISTRMVFFFMFLASVVLFESFRKITVQIFNLKQTYI